MTDAELAGLKQLLATPQPAMLGPGHRSGTLPETELAARLNPILTRARVPAQTGELVRALHLLWHDHLDASHNISQGVETADGSFVHAIMHRREPDAWNSKYWWRRVGDHPAFPEIARRADKLSGANNAKSLIARLLAHGRWNPDAFVDACDAAMNLPESDLQVKLLREIQSFETEALLEYLLGDTE